MTDFHKLNEAVKALNSTNSSNDKKVILAKYKNDEFITKVLFYTYNPFYQFYITPKTCEKHYNDDLGKFNVYHNLFDLLDALRHRHITGHAAIQAVNDFAFKNEMYKDLIYKILGKDLEIRMGDSLINKVIPNLIPSFDCALASSFEDVDVNFLTEEWFFSRKIDGCRDLTIVEEHPECWSRQGNQFETLGLVEKEIKSFGINNVVFDGEICLVDGNGDEDFQGIMKQIRKKGHTIQNPRYLVFDIIPLIDFQNKKGNTKYADRYAKLQEVVRNNKFVQIVTQILVRDNDHFLALMEEAKAKGWEGGILRKNVGYEGKRSKNMLKCKEFSDGEYIVDSIEVGPFRMIGSNGLEETVEVMTNVNITHKGNSVSVGSGFTIDERKYYKEHPEEIVGKVITVKYFEETINQQGKYSLRFPTFKILHGKKRTT